ncbi:hypothetical protein PsorP6_007154 [Peronosclerospora sorghi]|uniref:Uncharacterized protein n=1 Tax=Peronosclerospora sorghi TaxID=230839 RepID=A0ACC0W673_9STRA|nr:hypothetical protein PsorP6_007154 [Peronosclerospora sorghi]
MRTQNPFERSCRGRSGVPGPEEPPCSTPLIVHKPGVQRVPHDGRRPAVRQQNTTYRVAHAAPEYFQFLLATACQGYFSFLAEDGIYTPTSVLMGHRQRRVLPIECRSHVWGVATLRFAHMTLDDLLGYTETAEGLLVPLRGMFTVWRNKDLKLNPKKFF